MMSAETTILICSLVAVFTFFKTLSISAQFLGLFAQMMILSVFVVCGNGFWWIAIALLCCIIRYMNICTLQEAYEIFEASKEKKNVET